MPAGVRARLGRLFGAGMLGVAALNTSAAPQTLTAADVTRIIGQAVTEAQRVRLSVNIAVVDREGNVLGTYAMPKAPNFTVLDGGGDCPVPAVPGRPCGLEGFRIPPLDSPLNGVVNGAILAALSKAGTAAFFSTQGNAFTTRTAGFIIQQNFPPLVSNTSSGPLFGVQFSQLFCGDVIPRPGVTLPSPLPPLCEGTLPLGLSADPGGLPLYKDGSAAGGVGVEGDGRYTIDRDPTAPRATNEERIAVAATGGYGAPAAIRGDQIFVNGLRLPFANVGETVVPEATVSFGSDDVSPRNTPPSRFVPAQLAGVPGTVDPRYYPPRDGIDPPPPTGLDAATVQHVLARGARQASRTRAGIRRPLGAHARVNITVVDRAGNVLGIFRTQDAPTFGFDVSAQKARSVAFFSGHDAGAQLRAAKLDGYVAAARQQGIGLDGSVAFSDRAIGFLSRPFFPDGINGTVHGPFSVSIADFSVFNDGLQLDLILPTFNALFQVPPPLFQVPPPLPLCPFAFACTQGVTTQGAQTQGVPGLGNGLQIFPGSVPLYRGRTLIGAVGVSGDGVDQDDIISFAASQGLRAPRAMRSDRVRVRGVRLPFVKFPRRPTTP